MKIISINGVDNIGKTTQINLLKIRNNYNVKIMESLWKYNPILEKKLQEPWRWFNASNLDEYLVLMFDAILRRQEQALLSQEDLVVLDRGFAMFLATIKSTIQIKQNLSSNDATYIVDEFLDKNYAWRKSKEDASILLQFSNNDDANVNLTMLRSKEDWINYSLDEINQYKKYQYILNHELLKSQKNGDFSNIVMANRSVLEVQNDIRHALNTDFRMNVLGKFIDHIIWIGWLSESGKSTIWEKLSQNHGFTRLKVAYFANIVNQRYPWLFNQSPREFALRLFEAIDEFASTHYYLNNYTIESLRFYEVVKELKKLLWDKFKIVYASCDRQSAIQRTANNQAIDVLEAKAIVEKKDKEKISQEADKIQGLADIVVNNDFGVEQLNVLIQNLASLLDNNCEVNMSNSVCDLRLNASYSESILSVIDLLHNSSVWISLISLSWSVWRMDVDPRSSDIDFFIVADSLEWSEHLKMSLGQHKLLNKIKIWYTIIDKSSFEKPSLETDAKILYLIKNLNQLSSLILTKNGLTIPPYNNRDLIQALNRDKFIYIENTRKQINNAKNNDELLIETKHVYTIMKMCLIQKWFDKVEWYANVYAKFYEIYWSCMSIQLPNILSLRMNDLNFDDLKLLLLRFIDEILFLD